MTSEMATLPPAGSIRANPKAMKPTQNALRQIIAAAAALQRWEELEKAIDVQIEHQLEFCSWWLRNVQRPKGTVTSNVTDRISADSAHEQTGIRKQQVYRWQKALEDIDSYRALLIQTARRRAMLDNITRLRTNIIQPDLGFGIDPIETVAAELRNLMLKAMAERPFDEWAYLGKRLRDEVRDVEKSFTRLRAEMEERGKCA